MLIEGAIFDVDGTILDTMPVWHDAGARFLATLGIEAEEGLGDKLFAETVQTGAEYMIERYDLDMAVQDVADGINYQMEQFYFNEAPFKEGALELLKRLKDGGTKLAVATSTDRYCIEAAFRRLVIEDMFDVVLTCGEVGATKSRPDIFFEAVELMKTDIPSTWVFEDGLYAIKTARAEGFRTVGVYDKTSDNDQQEIMRYADFYYRTLADFEIM
jgi:HAD superfamily hydrolase (TIGR01509 family)